jgi:UDP-3-O-acyl-N-acetylglucosamine deacetylase
MAKWPDPAQATLLDRLGIVLHMKLAGALLISRFEGRRSSHALNAKLLRTLFSDAGNYEVVSG